MADMGDDDNVSTGRGLMSDVALVSDLRTEVSRLQRQLEEEREQWRRSESESLLLLQKVKQQWKDRESETLGKLQSELSASRAEQERLTEVKNQLKHKLVDCRAKLEHAVKAFEEEQSKCKVLLGDNVSIKDQMQEQLTTIRGLEKETEELQRKLEKSERSENLIDEENRRKEAEELKAQLNERDNRISDLESQLQREQEKREQTSQTFDEQLEKTSKTLQDELREKEKVIKLLHAELSAQKDKVKIAEEDVKGTKDIIQNLREDLSVVEKESEQEKQNLQSELERASKRIDELLRSSKDDEAKEEERHKQHLVVAELRESLEQSKNKLEKQSSKLDQLESLIRCLEEQKNRTEEEHKITCEQLEDTQKRIKEEQESNKNLKEAHEREIRNYSELVDKAQEELRQLEIKYNQDLANKAKKISALESELEELRLQMREQSSLEDLEARYKELEEKNKLLKESSDKEINKLTAERDKVVAELAQTTKEHEEYVKNIEKMSNLREEKEKRSESDHCELSTLKRSLKQREEEAISKLAKAEHLEKELKNAQLELAEQELKHRDDNEKNMNKISELEEIITKIRTEKTEGASVKESVKQEDVNKECFKETSENLIEDLTSKLNKARLELARRDQEYEEDMKKKSDKISELENLMHKLEDQREIEDKENDSSNVKPRDRGLESRKIDVEEVKKRNEELESRVKFLRSLMAERRQQFQNENEGLKQELEGLKKEKTKLHEEKVSSQEEINAKQIELIEALRSEKKTLETELTKKEKELKVLREDEEEKRAELESELDSLKESAASAKTLKHACLEMQDQILQYEKVLDKRKGEEDKFRIMISEVEKLKAELKEAKTALNESQSKLIKKNADTKELEQSLKGLEEQRESLRRKVEQKEQELKEMKDCIRKDELHSIENAKIEEHLKQRMQALTEANSKLEEEVRLLKEESSELRSQKSKYMSANEKMTKVVEETMSKIESKNEAIAELRRVIEQKEIELEEKKVQFAQVTKLVDHLDTAKISPVSYSELLDKLDSERGKVTQLEEQLKLQKSKPGLAPIDLDANRLMSSEPRHKIPHRFNRQTNLSSHRKCFVCHTSISIFDSIAVCKYCNVVTHSGVCQTRAKHDCGLPSDLASVINARGQLIKKGTLKVGESQGRIWSSCGVAQLFTDKFFLDDTSTINVVIDMDQCVTFDFVSVKELLHAAQPSQIHQSFKLVHMSNGKIQRSLVLMAESIEEKHSWLAYLCKSSTSEFNHKSSIVLPMDSNRKAQVHCVYQIKGNEKHRQQQFILATSQGLLFFENEKISQIHLKSLSPSAPIFNVLPINRSRELLLILGEDRRLAILEESAFTSISSSSALNIEIVQDVASAHLLAVKNNYLAVADDSRVSILSREEGGQFKLLFAFSTDQPSLALCFRDEEQSLLVATNDVYEVALVDFKVHEFFSCRNQIHKLIDIVSTPLGELLCFQNEAHLLSSAGIVIKRITWPGELIDYSIVCLESKVFINTTTGVHEIDLEDDKRSRCLVKGVNNFQILSDGGKQPLILCNEAKNKRVLRRLEM